MNGSHTLSDRFFDVIVVGAGWIGTAAALELAEKRRSVLLLDPGADLVWESSRAFFPECGPAFGDKRFEAFLAAAAIRTGVTGRFLDGAVAELLAGERLQEAGVTLLFQAMPHTAEERQGTVSTVWVTGKNGILPLHARQWVDATETGLLARLLPLAQPSRFPATLELRYHIQRREGFPRMGVSRWNTGGSKCRCIWTASHWPGESLLCLEMDGREMRPLRYVVPALRSLRKRLGASGADAFVSHSSFRPFPRYGGTVRSALPTFANAVIASPVLHRRALRFLGDRVALGYQVAQMLETLPRCEAPTDGVSRPFRPAQPDRCFSADVMVAGLGTGGTLAALAAAREGVRVLAIEPQSFAGGIATGGGIPMYYWGCEGGLQETLDDRVRELMPLFARREEWPVGFHPDAKRVAWDELLHEAGVQVLWESRPVSVVREGRHLQSVTLMTPSGRVVVDAPAWIDATGDGDLVFLAGASFSEGRSVDGMTQPYTQSCARFGLRETSLKGMIFNVDTGRLDPTDSADWTRARLAGLAALSEPVFNALHRPAAISPHLGVRESRRYDTDYRLTLDDLVERRRFPDAVGYTGAHYDNHSRDYEFESDDVFFYVSCAGLFWARTACEIPYRMVVPSDLDNLWIGCRAAGMTEEALHSMRMQRDIQRLGEVCGFAAALAVRHHTDNRGVPYRQLRKRLLQTGALRLRPPRHMDFGASIGPADMRYQPPTTASLRQDLAAALGKGDGMSLWRVFRHGRSLLSRILTAVRSNDPDRSWHAAQLLAAWGDFRAEPRLLTAIRRQEVGPECQIGQVDPREGSRGILPRWWQAVTLLRICGGRRAFRALTHLTESKDLPYRVRTAVALTLARLAERFPCPKRERWRLESALEALEGHPEKDDWAVVYACGRARRRFGLQDSPALARFMNDSRRPIRRLFLSLISSPKQGVR